MFTCDIASFKHLSSVWKTTQLRLVSPNTTRVLPTSCMFRWSYIKPPIWTTNLDHQRGNIYNAQCALYIFFLNTAWGHAYAQKNITDLNNGFFTMAQLNNKWQWFSCESLPPILNKSLSHNYSPKWRWIAVDIYQSHFGEVNIHCYSPVLRWMIIVLVYTTQV